MDRYFEAPEGVNYESWQDDAADFSCAPCCGGRERGCPRCDRGFGPEPGSVAAIALHATRLDLRCDCGRVTSRLGPCLECENAEV